MRTRFCETILREEGFAKPRLMFLKFGGVWVSAAQEGEKRILGASQGRSATGARRDRGFCQQAETCDREECAAGSVLDFGGGLKN